MGNTNKYFKFNLNDCTHRNDYFYEMYEIKKIYIINSLII